MSEPTLSIQALAREISSELRQLAVVDAASLRAIRRPLSVRVERAAPREVIELAREIVDAAPPGAYPIVYELLRYHPTALSAIEAADLEQLGQRMASWGEVDCFAAVAGYAWRMGRIGDAEVHRWAHSESRWWRRAALVATVPLNMKSHGGKGDPERTLAVCALLLDDRDDMVVKAMSWALRALATRVPAHVEAFVTRNQTRLAARVLREVRNKLRTGRKDGRSRTILG